MSTFNRHLLAALLAIGLMACSKEETTKISTAPSPSPQPFASLPSIDTSTPDRALKSYWQVLKASEDEIFQWRKKIIETRPNSAAQLFRNTASEKVLAYNESKFGVSKPTLAPPQQYDREILEVKLETESRATVVVRTRNSTPIPEGVKASTKDMEQREQGEKMKYLLEKVEGGWRVADVFRENPLSTKEDERWQRPFPLKNFLTPTNSVPVYIHDH